MGEFVPNEKNHKPHALLIPFPTQGHINPMFNVAKLLHGKGFHITFVNSEFSHQKLLNSQTDDGVLERLPGFKFATIPSTDFDILLNKNHQKMVSDLKTKFLGPVNALVKEINDSASKEIPPVTCMIADPFMIFTTDVAQNFDIPILLLFVFGASTVLTYPYIPKLVEDGILPLKDEKDYLDTVVNCIPGMDGIRLKDFPTFFRITDPNYAPYLYQIEILEKALDKKFVTGVILNTFEELEYKAIEELSSIFPTLFTIGPLHQLVDQVPNDQLDSIALNLIKEDLTCLEWLDSNPTNSVIFVSFGTTGFLNPKQLEEFAWGLADSKQTFLWVIRPELVLGDSSILSSEFESEIKDRSLLINWCPQEKVLRHPAIGGYLTHCGWNSIIEGVSAGVPMLCWPNYADQTMNSWISCNNWGIGMEIGNDVRRNVVENLVRELMIGEKGKEMRKKALDLKKKAEEAVNPTGSSFGNFEKMVELLSSGGIHKG